MTGSIWKSIRYFTILSLEQEMVLAQLFLMTHTESVLETIDFEKVIIFYGHFALKQLELLSVPEGKSGRLKKSLFGINGMCQFLSAKN